MVVTGTLPPLAVGVIAGGMPLAIASLTNFEIAGTLAIEVLLSAGMPFC
ncbi:MAG: hypothetical protein HC778_08980 [Chamaesiphon sp. CSU_1_12]|nr:hypothetical protein [Chamaesiphon sp. CSU_1_12]